MGKNIPKAPYITGLYGCSCHPFSSWEEHDQFQKQVLHNGYTVKQRHTGKIGVIVEEPEKGLKYYMVQYNGGRFASDNHQEHVSNLIIIKKNTYE